MNTSEYPDGKFLRKLAHHAGPIMARYFGQNARHEFKGDDTPVIERVDVDINKLVCDEIGRNFPHVHVVGEEGNREVADARYRVIFDPTDGTIPYLWDLPVSTFCVAALEGDVPLAAAVYDPFHHRLWLAERGKGTWLYIGGHRIRQCYVSEHSDLKRSNASIIHWHGSDYRLSAVQDELMAHGVVCGNMLSVAIFGGLIAGGQVHASIFPGRKSVETPAMQLLVEEAGGKATDILGSPLTYGPNCETNGHIISNGLLHDQLVDIVASCQW